MNYSKEIVNAITSLLDSDDWHYDFHEKDGVITFAASLESGLKGLDYFVKICPEYYSLSASIPQKVDERHYPAMREFICRITSDITEGHFELDMEHGELCFNSFVNCHGDTVPTEEIVHDSIYIPAYYMEQYAPGILAILDGKADAKEAYELCEHSDYLDYGFSDDSDDELFADADSSDDAVDPVLIQRYQNEHERLPAAFFDDPQKFIKDVCSGKGKFMADFYNHISPEFEDIEDFPVYASSDFSISEQTKNGRHIVVITLPDPETSPLCKKVGCSVDKDGGNPIWRTVELMETGEYCLCGWSNGGATHINTHIVKKKVHLLNDNLIKELASVNS